MTTLGFKELGNPQGSPLAITHGWATDSHFTEPLAELFNDRRVILIDMPGYGLSAHLKYLAGDILATADALLATIPNNCDLMAWSLSSLTALQACSHDHNKIRSLITICGTPRFPADPNWPGFSYSYIVKSQRYFTRDNVERLLRLFFTLQTRSNKNTPAINEFILSCSKKLGNIDFNVLKKGLDDMAYTDLRESLSKIKIPTLHLFGKNDRLVPYQQADSYYFGQQHQCFIFENSAHMPYLTEPELFKTVVTDFCDKLHTFNQH